MGLLSKILGGTPDYPQLQPDMTAAQQLKAIRTNLEELTREVKEPMEVVPGELSAYVFIGKPPKRFGIAWIEDDQIKSFKSVVAEQNVSQQMLNKVSDDLREAYKRHDDATRYQTKVGDREITVTPSEALKDEVRSILTSLH